MNLSKELKANETKDEVTRHMQDIWTKHHDPVERLKRRITNQRESIKEEKLSDLGL